MIGPICCYLRFPIVFSVLTVGNFNNSVGQLMAQEEMARSGSVTGHPFSAIKYSYKAKLLDDHKFAFVTNLHYPIRLARDVAGRLRWEGVLDPTGSECDKLELKVPPPCPAWDVILFDPSARTVSHWVEGESGGHTAVAITLSASRTEEILKLTSTLPTLDRSEGSDDSIVAQDLGNKVVDGILSAGQRIVLAKPTERTKVKFVREIWVSRSMNLIVKHIEALPDREEVISGLTHVSLLPDPKLFQIPQSYRVQFRNGDNFSDQDVSKLSTWFVQ